MQKSGKATQICNFFWILSAVRIRFHLNFLFRACFWFWVQYWVQNCKYTSSAVVSRGEEEVGDAAAAAKAAPAAAQTTPMLQKLFWSSV